MRSVSCSSTQRSRSDSTSVRERISSWACYQSEHRRLIFGDIIGMFKAREDIAQSQAENANLAPPVMG